MGDFSVDIVDYFIFPLLIAWFIEYLFSSSLNIMSNTSWSFGKSDYGWKHNFIASSLFVLPYIFHSF
jgi:hypothetical protein